MGKKNSNQVPYASNAKIISPIITLNDKCKLILMTHVQMVIKYLRLGDVVTYCGSQGDR